MSVSPAAPSADRIGSRNLVFLEIRLQLFEQKYYCDLNEVLLLSIGGWGNPHRSCLSCVLMVRSNPFRIHSNLLMCDCVVYYFSFHRIHTKTLYNSIHVQIQRGEPRAQRRVY